MKITINDKNIFYWIYSILTFLWSISMYYIGLPTSSNYSIVQMLNFIWSAILIMTLIVIIIRKFLDFKEKGFEFTIYDDSNKDN